MDIATAFPWLECRLERAPTTRAVRVGEQSALFCERRQQLFGLNPTAELIWRELTAGRAPAEVADDLATLGAEPPQAVEFVAASAWEWLRTGQLAPARVRECLDAAPSAELALRIGPMTCRVRLYLGAGDDLGEEIASVFGQFAVGEAAGGVSVDLVADGGGYFLLLDGASFGVFPRNRIVPQVKAVLTERLSHAPADGAFLLHAALLSSRGRGLLISGRPGAGKTTLTLALAARGLGYASDDIVEVSADGRLQGVRFSPALKAGAWSLAAPYWPAVETLPVHLRDDGQQVRYVPVDDLASGAVERLGWVLLLDRREGVGPSLEPLEPIAVLTELLASAYCADHRLRADTLQALAESLTGAVCRRLVYSDLGEAVSAIEAMTA